METKKTETNDLLWETTKKCEYCKTEIKIFKSDIAGIATCVSVAKDGSDKSYGLFNCSKCGHPGHITKPQIA